MKASFQWIMDYLPQVRLTPQQMADVLTFSGTEVESHLVSAGDDWILEAGVTSNRPDELCHGGLAREVAAVTGATLVLPESIAVARGRPTAEVCSVKLGAPDLCPRLTVRVIEGVKVAPSPEWLVKRLTAIGLRPVNNVVDVTNFVLWECGQPLHAFDLDRLRGATIEARRARAGEKLDLLNGTTIVLRAEDLVIADTAGPVGLAGIMGGRESEVSNATQRIALESAFFAPGGIRRSARHHQLRSDASYRFERGIDRARSLIASERAARLIMEVAGGTLCTTEIDLGGPGETPAAIALRPTRVSRVLGAEVSEDTIRHRLTALGVAVHERSGLLLCTPPSFRRDLTREIDLVEEVVRLSDLSALSSEPRMPVRMIRPHPNREIREDLRDRLVTLGYTEVLTPDFVKEGAASEARFLLDGEGLSVRAPIRSGESGLRRSPLGSLLRVRKHNADQGNRDLWIFEVANLHALETSSGGVQELPVLAGLIDGNLRDARFTLDRLLEPHGIGCEIGVADDAVLELGQRASVLVGARRIAVFGRPARKLVQEFGLKDAPVYWELDLEAVRALKREWKGFGGLPRFPASTRDLTVDVADATPYSRFERALLSVGASGLEGFELVDLYRGKNLGEGMKSWTLRFTFRSDSETLTAEAVEAEMAKIMVMCEEKLGARIRKG